MTLSFQLADEAPAVLVRCELSRGALAGFVDPLWSVASHAWLVSPSEYNGVACELWVAVTAVAIAVMRVTDKYRFAEEMHNQAAGCHGCTPSKKRELFR